MTAIRSHRRQLLLPAVAALLAIGLTGTGSFAAPVRPAAATCTSTGTALKITAFDQKFDKDCLAAPADTNLTIDFNNLDRGIPHNVAIYEHDPDESAGKTFFKGELTDGPGQQTYSVPGIPAGTWFFRCDPHPEMRGTFIAG